MVDEKDRLVGTITLADLGDDLQRAIRMFTKVDEGLLAVVDDVESMKLVACLHERDVMRAYNQALIAQRAEEHGETL